MVAGPGPGAATLEEGVSKGIITKGVSKGIIAKGVSKGAAAEARRPGLRLHAVAGAPEEVIVKRAL